MKETFLEKYKSDKKYKAKIQLIGYVIFIVLIILYVNISTLNSSTSNNNIISKRNNSTTQEIDKNNKEDEKKSSLLKKMNTNYEFEIKASITSQKEEIEEKKEVIYTGKRAKNNTEITKKTQDITSTFYKVDSRYYTKNNEEYQLIKQEEIYDIIEKEYIEWDDIKEYIEKSSLDHVTDYSSGKKEYVYHLKVKDIIKSHPEAEEVEINITEENDVLTINFDYTNLMKVLLKETKECKMTATYKNIEKVEEFKIIEEQENDPENQGATNE